MADAAEELSNKLDDLGFPEDDLDKLEGVSGDAALFAKLSKALVQEVSAAPRCLAT